MPNEEYGIAKVSSVMTPTSIHAENNIQAQTVMSATKTNYSYRLSSNNDTINGNFTHESMNGSFLLPSLSYNESSVSDTKSYSYIIGTR